MVLHKGECMLKYIDGYFSSENLFTCVHRGSDTMKKEVWRGITWNDLPVTRVIDSQ